MRGLRFIVVIAGTVMVFVGCSDRTPVGVPAESPQHSVLGDLLGSSGLLHCASLPSDSVTETVGPEGGTVRVGQHKLVIPREALAGPVSITAVAPSDDRNRVVLGPEGLTFDRPASLTLSYANCSLLGLVRPRRVAYLDGNLGIIEHLVSLDDWSSQSVTAPLDHFSNYAVAW